MDDFAWLVVVVAATRDFEISRVAAEKTGLISAPRPIHDSGRRRGVGPRVTGGRRDDAVVVVTYIDIAIVDLS